jgi:hypothetical protein
MLKKAPGGLMLLVYEMIDVIEPYHTDEDEVESDDVVQQARDYQNQNVRRGTAGFAHLSVRG